MIKHMHCGNRGSQRNDCPLLLISSTNLLGETQINALDTSKAIDNVLHSSFEQIPFLQSPSQLCSWIMRFHAFNTGVSQGSVHTLLLPYINVLYPLLTHPSKRMLMTVLFLQVFNILHNQ